MGHLAGRSLGAVTPQPTLTPSLVPFLVKPGWSHFPRVCQDVLWGLRRGASSNPSDPQQILGAVPKTLDSGDMEDS